MTNAEPYYFADFMLDPQERRLFLQQQPVELNSRYLDALLLLVLEQGKLVSKERFFSEVWPGMVVSDEALTQCIRTLRRVLQDKAAAPLFIETVPKHGYRFIAAVRRTPTRSIPDPAGLQSTAVSPRQRLWQLTGHGVAGAAMAGLVGGTLYGLSAAFGVVSSTDQTLSVMLVMLSITTLIAVLGGAAVSLGLALAQLYKRPHLSWLLLGGGTAGLAVGAFVSLLLQEAFLLFLGRSPLQITGAAEGLVLGLAAACSYWLLMQPHHRWRLVCALAPGMMAGGLLSVSGGVLLAGSLAQWVVQFPQATALLWPNSQLLLTGTAVLEAGLFTAGLTLGLQRGIALTQPAAT